MVSISSQECVPVAVLFSFPSLCLERPESIENAKMLEDLKF